MAAAFDAESTQALTTGPQTWNHTPAGTPAGALVIIVEETGTDTVDGVTYGGTPMVEVPLSPILYTSPETGSIHAFFLSAPAAGVKAVAVSGASMADWIGACWTVTSATGLAEVHDTSAMAGATGQTTVGATLTITKNSFVAGGMYSGLAAPGFTEVAGTQLVVEGDLGADSGGISRGDSIKTADFAYTWTQGSDDGMALVVAICEAAVPAPQLVTPGPVALTATLLVPTVTVTQNQTVTPGPVALTLTRLVPTVTTSANVTVTPGPVALTLSPLVPVVTASDNKTVTPGPVAITATLYAPTVTTTANQTVTPDPVAMTLTGLVPTVTGGAGTTVTPGLVALTLTALVPTVTASDNIVVTPGVAAFNLSLYAPTVSVSAGGNVTVTPDTVGLVLAAFAPTVTATASASGSIGTPGRRWLVPSRKFPRTRDEEDWEAIIAALLD